MSLAEMADAQAQYVEQGLVDFVVTNKPCEFEKYELVDEASMLYEGEVRDYYLYQLSGE